MKKKKTQKNIIEILLSFIKTYWKHIVVIAIFLCEIFLRFYHFSSLNPFGWDQIDNAWAAKHILIDHNFPLTGMVIKQNSNVNIGPLYYYFVSIFYFFTHLDPIASGIIAGVSSMISFWILFFTTKKLFSFPVALIAIIINTFSIRAIFFLDRIQWPVAFLPGISLLIFYLLYLSIIKSPKYLIWIGLLIGISFHLHFTSIFFPLCVLCALPFLPRQRQTIFYGLLGTGVAIIFLIPSIITFFQANYFSHALIYGNSYYQGFHLRRMLQIIDDAFIQFIPYTTDSFSSLLPSWIIIPFEFLRFFYLPLFSFLILRSKFSKENKVLIYLSWIWFVVPWVVFTVYRGEISEYYFSVNKFIALFILSYFLWWLYQRRIIFKGIVIIMLLGYVVVNTMQFFQANNPFSLDYYRAKTLDEIAKGNVIQFVGGAPESYLYYVYKIMKWPYPL